MPPQITINARKFDGQIHRTWSAELIASNPQFAEFFGTFDQTIHHESLGTIEAGTASYEFYWFDRWFNIFRFHNPDGDLRNYYCNVNLPPEFKNGVLDYIDLDLDVLVTPTLSYQILDRAEFEKNCRLFDYPKEVRRKALGTVDLLIDMVKNRCFPFDYQFREIIFPKKPQV